jgi:hypothetical protein
MSLIRVLLEYYYTKVDTKEVLSKSRVR